MAAKERDGVFLCYKPQNFNAESLRKLEIINRFIAQYQRDGFDLTVRQIHYILVKNNQQPNNQKAYDTLGNLISNGRMAGLVSWTAIVDRGRGLKGHTYWTSPAAIIQASVEGYRIDKWADQSWRPIVRVEKQALEGVVGQICNRLEVDFLATKGYNSQSVEWREGRRMARYIQQGQRPIIFYLGDFDPSGLDMTRDCRERLSLFTGQDVMVQRIGLNMPQIKELDLPPNPAKQTDSRFDAYEAEWGTRSSWELDALDPHYVQALIEDAVSKVRDEAIWEKSLAIEVGDKRVLMQAAEALGGESSEDADDVEDGPIAED